MINNMTPKQFEEAINEFKEIYKMEFGIELSDQEANEKANGLLKIFMVAKN